MTDSTAATRPPWATYRPPVPGETRRQAEQRRTLNRDEAHAWDRYVSDRCAACGQVRFHRPDEPDVPDLSLLVDPSLR